MMRCTKCLLLLTLVLGVWAGTQGLAASSPSTLAWHPADDRVSADIHGEALWPLLEDIAHQTGWHILVEPGADRLADVKFNNLPPGEALKKLLGDLNFALVPQTNGPDSLYVFMTTMQAATRTVAPPAVVNHRHVANQLLVTLKPGVDIDALAKALGAKVVGRNDKLHTYLLEFPNATSTDAALTLLQNNSDVQSVSYNNYFDPPPVPQAVVSAPVAEPSLTLDSSTPNNPCDPVVGLIDTQVQPLGNGLDQFLETPISVVGNTTPVTGTITHGTAMAETILNAISQTSGGHSGVKILPVDVYASGDSTTTWDVALGVQAAVDGGANVLNMSLGTSDSSAVFSALPAVSSRTRWKRSTRLAALASSKSKPGESSPNGSSESGERADSAIIADLSAHSKRSSQGSHGSYIRARKTLAFSRHQPQTQGHPILAPPACESPELRINKSILATEIVGLATHSRGDLASIFFGLLSTPENSPASQATVARTRTVAKTGNSEPKLTSEA